MAHTGIFATKAECDSKSGSNVDTTGYSEANINSWCSMSESEINVTCSYNFSDAYAGLNADVKKILADWSSNIVAIYAWNYDPSGQSNAEPRPVFEDRVMTLAYRNEILSVVLKSHSKSKYLATA
jgi:hypothetical protein